MKHKKEIIIISVAIILLFTINYAFLDNSLINFLGDEKTVYVTDIIDGDTIKTNEESIRLLGIDSPERGERYFYEAGDYLFQKIKDKNVTLKTTSEKYDKYDRLLAYVIFNNANLNLEMVEKGYANYYFPSGRGEYFDEFYDAWQKCLENGENLCEKSTHKCNDCIVLGNTENNKKKSVKNTCSFECDVSGWSIKAEGREKIIFSDEILNPQEELYVVMDLDKQDTLFLRDKKGKLVLWKDLNELQ